MKKKVKPTAVTLSSINADKGLRLNDLEATLLCFQKLIKGKVKEGKKGIVLFKGTDSEYKMSYQRLQAMLWELNTYFSMKGAFSFGICADCENFDNGCSTDGTFGYCRGRERYMFDSCDSFKGDGGFGKEGN